MSTEKRPVRGYKIPATYHLDQHDGAGCFLCPPGHPRYFVKSIYTQYGNSPRWGSPCYYLSNIGFFDLEQVDRLYGSGSFPKLALDHPRTQAWEAQLYAYMRNCYKTDKSDTDIIKDPEWEKENATKHKAFLHIKEHYPEYVPNIDLILNPPKWGNGSGGTWWERLTSKPTPESCPGYHNNKHPVNETWCQVCGWEQEVEND